MTKNWIPAPKGWQRLIAGENAAAVAMGTGSPAPSETQPSPQRTARRRGGPRKPPLSAIVTTIEAYYSSGLTQADFCNPARRRLGERTLRDWIRRLEREDPATLTAIKRRYGV